MPNKQTPIRLYPLINIFNPQKSLALRSQRFFFFALARRNNAYIRETHGTVQKNLSSLFETFSSSPSCTHTHTRIYTRALSQPAFLLRRNVLRLSKAAARTCARVPARRAVCSALSRRVYKLEPRARVEPVNPRLHNSGVKFRWPASSYSICVRASVYTVGRKNVCV